MFGSNCIRKRGYNWFLFKNKPFIQLEILISNYRDVLQLVIKVISNYIQWV